jgi:hypothetical protein
MKLGMKLGAKRFMDHQEKLLNLLSRGASPQEIRDFLVNIPEEELTDEPIECNIVARRFIDGARERAALLVDRTGTCFPNPRDRQTAIDLLSSPEIAMGFCNVKDSLGGQFANTVDELATRCLNAESGSAQNARIIDQLRDEILDLQHQLGRSKGGKN